MCTVDIFTFIHWTLKFKRL